MAVIIITGAIDSGKTSWCMKNLVESSAYSCDGVLLFKQMVDSKSCGYNAVRISTGESIPFARRQGFLPENWQEEEKTGIFSISKSGKMTANRWIRESLSGSCRGIVIDEIGPLEISGRGFADSVHYVLEHADSAREIFLVIRDNCVKRVLSTFNIKPARYIYI